MDLSFLAYPLFASVATFGVVLGAAYMLWLFQRTMFGEPTAENAHIRDMSWREVGLPVAAGDFDVLDWPVPTPLSQSDGTDRESLCRTDAGETESGPAQSGATDTNAAGAGA